MWAFPFSVFDFCSDNFVQNESETWFERKELIYRSVCCSDRSKITHSDSPTVRWNMPITVLYFSRLLLVRAGGILVHYLFELEQFCSEWCWCWWLTFSLSFETKSFACWLGIWVRDDHVARLWPWSMRRLGSSWALWYGSHVNWQVTIGSSCGQGCTAGQQKGGILAWPCWTAKWVECCPTINRRNLGPINFISAPSCCIQPSLSAFSLSAPCCRRYWPASAASMRAVQPMLFTFSLSAHCLYHSTCKWPPHWRKA